jgi:hypothetical protein
MPNIKFSYCYRDSGNYKNYGAVIFANTEGIDLSVVNNLIQAKLIDGTWFYASRWNIPNLFFASIDIEADPTWHQFEFVEYTEENSTRQLSDLFRSLGS